MPREKLAESHFQSELDKTPKTWNCWKCSKQKNKSQTKHQKNQNICNTLEKWEWMCNQVPTRLNENWKLDIENILSRVHFNLNSLIHSRCAFNFGISFGCDICIPFSLSRDLLNIESYIWFEMLFKLSFRYLCRQRNVFRLSSFERGIDKSPRKKIWTEIKRTCVRINSNLFFVWVNCEIKGQSSV